MTITQNDRKYFDRIIAQLKGYAALAHERFERQAGDFGIIADGLDSVTEQLEDLVPDKNEEES